MTSFFIDSASLEHKNLGDKPLFGMKSGVIIYQPKTKNGDIVK